MKGYTLLEVIVVIAIIGILSAFASAKFNQLRKETIINLAADEFASELKTARVKSMAGEVEEGEVLTDFEEGGLPSFGVLVSANTYALFRDYIAEGDALTTRQDLETTTLDSTFNISGDSEVVFPRLTGAASATFIIENEGTNGKRQVSINSEGVISITKI